MRTPSLKYTVVAASVVLLMAGFVLHFSTATAQTDCQCNGTECESYNGCTPPNPATPWADLSDLCKTTPIGCGKEVPRSVARWNVSGCSAVSDAAGVTAIGRWDKHFDYTGGTDQTGHRKIQWKTEFKASFAGWAAACQDCDDTDSWDVTVRAKIKLDPTAQDCPPADFGWFVVATMHIEVESNCSTTTAVAGATASGSVMKCCQCDDNDHITDITPTVEIEHKVQATNGTGIGTLSVIRGAASSTCEMTKDDFVCTVGSGPCPSP